MTRIPYLNAVPFYSSFEGGDWKILPVVPRRLGILSRQGEVQAGLYSLMDYFEQSDDLELIDFCIATRDQVRSVMLFAKDGWRGLEGKRIAVTDETATSVVLLRILLEKKYGVRAQFVRLHGGVNDLTPYDAVLLIGDEALRRRKSGLAGFECVFDLAREWYDWQHLPFVFAVWAMSRSLRPEAKEELRRHVLRSLEHGWEHSLVVRAHGGRLGLSEGEAEEYLDGFNYHIGERERE
ncbi:MAG: menaquinone biosynthesis protein, partial [Ignavibacteria bacterium]|nr:menaquinone biosynthesis protein [Ignavibacteria bacterium]